MLTVSTPFRDHLTRIREYERRAFPEDMADPEPGCVIPERGSVGGVPHGDAADRGGEGIDSGLTELVAHWRLMADLYALAVQCDMLRFGAVTYMSAGERIRLTGRYEYEGRLIYDFDDRRDRGTGGAQGCSHEFWHVFNEGAANTQLRAHLHLKMREVAYFLKALDQNEHRDENGKTILENAMVTVSTESGDGRHNDVRRELSGIFHAISSGNDRFAVGNIHDVGAEGIDVYNTMLSAYGVPMKLGPGGRPLEEVSAILR